MNVQFQSICDKGAVRPNNEDAIQFGLVNDQQIAWMVIADGMGGHQAGEIASELLVNNIENAFNQLKLQKRFNFTDNDWLCWIEIELNRANNKIYSESKINTQYSGMGTTAVLAVIQGHQCYVGWVGDSRCYHFDSKKQQLVQITTDHTLVQALVDKGSITQQEALQSHNKNMLSRAIGVKKGLDVETKQLAIHNQDIILLSTDGLHDNLREDILLSSAQQITKGYSVTDDLVQQAITAGSKDNITFGSIFLDKNLS